MSDEQRHISSMQSKDTGKVRYTSPNYSMKNLRPRRSGSDRRLWRDRKTNGGDTPRQSRETVTFSIYGSSHVALNNCCDRDTRVGLTNVNSLNMFHMRSVFLGAITIELLLLRHRSAQRQVSNEAWGLNDLGVKLSLCERLSCEGQSVKFRRL